MSRLLLYRSRNRWSCTCSKNISCGALQTAELLNDFTVLKKCQNYFEHMNDQYSYKKAVILCDISLMTRDHFFLDFSIFYNHLDLAYKFLTETKINHCQACKKYYHKINIYSMEIPRVIRMKLLFLRLAIKLNINMLLTCYMNNGFISLANYLNRYRIPYTIDHNSQYILVRQTDISDICKNVHQRFI